MRNGSVLFKPGLKTGAILGWLLAALSFSHTLNAASVYTIEMIVFERFSPSGGEYFPGNPGSPNMGKASGSLNASGGGITVLSKDSHRLGPVP